MLFDTAAEWHAALNDLPPALLLASVIFDWLGSATKRDSLKAAGFWALVAGVAGAALAVTSGLLAEGSIEHGETVHRVMERHETWAIAVGVGFALLAAWRIWRKGVLGPPRRHHRLPACRRRTHIGAPGGAERAHPDARARAGRGTRGGCPTGQRRGQGRHRPHPRAGHPTSRPRLTGATDSVDPGPVAGYTGARRRRAPV